MFVDLKAWIKQYHYLLIFSRTPYHKNNIKFELLDPENLEVDVNFVKIGQVFTKIFHFTFSPLGALARRLNVLKHEYLWCETTNFKKFFLNSAKHKRADFKDGPIDVTSILCPLVAKVNINEIPRNFIFIVR